MIAVEPWRPAERPRAVLLLDPDDGALPAAHFRDFGGIEHGRVLVRPTPGCTSLPDFARDLLTAVGKNPLVTGAIRPSTPTAWREARAWLAAESPTDLVIDRAHLLAPEILAAAALAAAEIDATVWLIWSDQRESEPVRAALENLDLSFETRPVTALPRSLPSLPAHIPPAPEQPNLIRPLLPTADFPLFLAHARRQLTAEAFKQLARLYQPPTSAPPTGSVQRCPTRAPAPSTPHPSPGGCAIPRSGRSPPATRP